MVGGEILSYHGDSLMKGKVKETKLTHERLLEVLDYDPKTGVFVWKQSRAKNVKAGQVAGKNPTNNGHRYIGIDFEYHTASRLAWLYVMGEWPRTKVRFKNGNISDCRFENLVLSKGVHGEFDFRSRDGRVAYGRAYREANPEKEKARGLQDGFKMSLRQYGDWMLLQNGKCAICQNPEVEMRAGKLKALAVDHCHKTGRIRGLLCCRCNQGLGKFREDRDILLAAIRYLDGQTVNECTELQEGNSS